jgi:hypothetical protein
VQTVSFGVTDAGFISGRIFNDLALTGLASAGDQPGLMGVRVSVRSNEGTGQSTVFEFVTDGSGTFNFPGLGPGKYVLEIQPESLPADFRIPEQTGWDISVTPLSAVYFDIPLAAQRSVSGVVFIDNNSNGRFDPDRDETVTGVSIISGHNMTVSGEHGAFILRNLRAGNITIFAHKIDGSVSSSVVLDLGTEPIARNGINLGFPAIIKTKLFK